MQSSIEGYTGQKGCEKCLWDAGGLGENEGAVEYKGIYGKKQLQGMFMGV